MRNDSYPPGAVLALLATDNVSDNTRNVLQARIDKKPVTIPRVFSPVLFVTLQVVCQRLIPQPGAQQVDLPGCLDDLLFEDKGNGWRYNTMPQDREAFTEGIKGISQAAQALFGTDFHLLEVAQQDEILTQVQSGKVPGDVWQKLPAALFFEELLAALTELYYSHPYAKEIIGEVAFADEKGWNKIGLDEREPREPLSLNV